MGLAVVMRVLAACGCANIDGGRTSDAACDGTSARPRLQGHLEALAPPGISLVESRPLTATT